MKKELIKLGLATSIVTTSLFGFTYEIKQGWQQLGAIKDFDDLKPFDDASCVEYLWHYDLDEPVEADKWKLHISDGKTYNYCGKTFSSLKKGDGFWLKASGECNVTVTEPNNCNSSGFPTPPSLDGSTCDLNGSIATGLPATTTVIYSNMAGTEENISNIIENSKETPIINSGTFGPDYTGHGYFYDTRNISIIRVDQSFRLWSTVSDLYPAYRGQIKITNLDTNQSIITKEYPEDPIPITTYYEMTDTLPAGTYRFEKATEKMAIKHYRMDDGWFFEKYK